MPGALPSSSYKYIVISPVLCQLIFDMLRFFTIVNRVDDWKRLLRLQRATAIVIGSDDYDVASEIDRA